MTDEMPTEIQERLVRNTAEAARKYEDSTPGWGSLTKGDQARIRYLAKHLMASEQEAGIANPHAGDSAELAWEGFDELKQQWLEELVISLNRNTHEGAVKTLEALLDKNFDPEVRFDAARALMHFAKER